MRRPDFSSGGLKTITFCSFKTFLQPTKLPRWLLFLKNCLARRVVSALCLCYWDGGTVWFDVPFLCFTLFVFAFGLALTQDTALENFSRQRNIDLHRKSRKRWDLRHPLLLSPRQAPTVSHSHPTHHTRQRWGALILSGMNTSGSPTKDIGVWEKVAKNSWHCLNFNVINQNHARK